MTGHINTDSDEQGSSRTTSVCCHGHITIDGRPVRSWLHIQRLAGVDLSADPSRTMTQKCSPDVLTDTAASPATAKQRLLKLSHLYHVAYSEDLYSILRRGIQPSKTSHRDKLESALPQVAEQFDLDFPINRRNCVFFYPRIQQALRQVPTGSTSDTLSTSQEIVVVDGAEIDQPLYIGEFRLISDAIVFILIAKSS